jgi:hypothetical protein
MSIIKLDHINTAESSELSGNPQLLKGSELPEVMPDLSKVRVVCAKCRGIRKVSEMGTNRDRPFGIGYKCLDCCAELAQARRDTLKVSTGRTTNYQYFKPDPLKYRAKSAVHRAVKRGDIIRPEACECCSYEPGFTRDGRALIQAHHVLGYDREHWLDVVWVCPRCHGLLDRIVPETMALGVVRSGEDYMKMIWAYERRKWKTGERPRKKFSKQRFILLP